MTDLKNKVVIITGGGQGLGKAISLCLATVGMKTVVADIQADKSEQVVAEIKQHGGQALSLPLDIGDEQSIKSCLEKTLQEFGQLDAVVNNAGIDVTKSISDITFAEIDRVLRINLRGTFFMSKAALEHMYTKKSGHVINIASTAAKRAWANASAYHASKWGIVGLSRGLYIEAREHNVKVSTVVPGGMKTPFILERFPDTDPSKLQDPENVAEVVKFVLSQPEESIIPEVMVLPLMESSWP